VLDAVLPADPIEEHFGGRVPEPAGEDLAVEFLSDVKSSSGVRRRWLS
jgi:hypothetical protein